MFCRQLKSFRILPYGNTYVWVGVCVCAGPCTLYRWNNPWSASDREKKTLTSWIYDKKGKKKKKKKKEFTLEEKPPLFWRNSSKEKNKKVEIMRMISYTFCNARKVTLPHPPPATWNGNACGLLLTISFCLTSFRPQDEKMIPNASASHPKPTWCRFQSFLPHCKIDVLLSLHWVGEGLGEGRSTFDKLRVFKKEEGQLLGHGRDRSGCCYIR